MTHHREKFYALGILLLFLAGTLLSVLRGREYWPFCYYPMFTQVRSDWHHGGMQLSGMPVDGGELILSAGYFENCLAKHTLNRSLARIAERADPRELEQALAYLLSDYRAARRENRHEGPELRGIVLYHCNWALRPEADNVKSPHRRMIGNYFDQ